MVTSVIGRLLLFAVAGLIAVSVPAHAEIEPHDLTLTVTPERNANNDPYAGEMVLLRIRGVYKQAILLEEFVQPSLANFSWTQLGRDHWGKTKLSDGQSAIQFDRTIAIFPHHAGRFVIEPFTHRLTVNDSGARRSVEVRSSPIALPVAEWTQPTGGPDAKTPWWLPAHDVSITDSWNPDPETIKLGETTRRVVTIEAQGMVAEGLPPRPVMRTRGILTFAGPVTRETLITPAGPIARATYRWDVRPGVPEVIPLDAVVIPWFDTTTRTMREVEIPARQIGVGLLDADEGGNVPASAPSPITIGAAALVAFGLGCCIIRLGSAGPPPLRLSGRMRRRLRTAAKNDDRHAFRAFVATARQKYPELFARWEQDVSFAADLVKLDQAIFTAHQSPKPDLARLARIMSRPHKVARSVVSRALRPIDGPA